MHVEGADQQAVLFNDRNLVDAQPFHHLDGFGGEFFRADGARRGGHHVAGGEAGKVELLQQGESLMPAEPWASMPNTGVW